MTFFKNLATLGKLAKAVFAEGFTVYQNVINIDGVHYNIKLETITPDKLPQNENINVVSSSTIHWFLIELLDTFHDASIDGYEQNVFEVEGPDVLVLVTIQKVV